MGIPVLSDGELSEYIRGMLHLSVARKIIESGQPLQIGFWKKNGEACTNDSVVCTSSNYARNTFNLKFLESGEIRTIRAILVFEVNHEEVVL